MSGRSYTLESEYEKGGGNRGLDPLKAVAKKVDRFTEHALRWSSMWLRSYRQLFEDPSLEVEMQELESRNSHRFVPWAT
jgi:hypothetical protein